MTKRWPILAVATVLSVSACQAASPTPAPTTAVAAATAQAPNEAPTAALVVTGIITSLDSPSLGRVDGFELLTPDGQKLSFDTTELPAQPEFPIAHLAEHQVLSDPIEVTYLADGERLIVTRLDDAS